MKKLLALVLALVMVMGLAACGNQPAETTPAPTEAPTTKAPETTLAPTEAPTTKAPETTPAPEPVVIGKILILNDLLKDLEAVKDPENTRYQAYWLNGYKMDKFVEDNFWFAPADETAAKIVAYSDMYTWDGLNFATFKNQALCLDVPEGLQKNYPEGLFFGLDVKKDNHPYNVGWASVGPEAMLLVNGDGFEVSYLFEDLKMVEADSYDFICADGFTHTYEADELADVSIFFSESGTADATYLPDKKYTLMDILYIVPHGLTAETAAEFEVPEDGIAKITVVNSAVKNAEPDYVGPFGGTVQEGYKVSDILAAAELTEAVESVKAISLGESATTEIPYDQFIERYIVPKDSKDRGAYTVGRSQAYGQVTINVGCYVLGDNILLYVPDSAADKDTGIALTAILAKLGVEYTGVHVICSDGFDEVIEAEDLEGIKIYHVGENVDVDSVKYAGSTLADTVAIEILK